MMVDEGVARLENELTSAWEMLNRISDWCMKHYGTQIERADPIYNKRPDEVAIWILESLYIRCGDGEKRQGGGR